MTTDQQKSIIADYCATRPEIAACYLYGSRATDKERPGSDVDLAFLLDASVAAEQYYDLKMTYYAALGTLLRLDIHPLIMNDAGEVVLGQVFKNWIVVCGADSLEFKQFKMYRCVQIAEFNDQMRYIETMKTIKYCGCEETNAKKNRHQKNSDHRSWPDCHWPGLRIRLLRHPGMQGPERGRV